MASVKGISLVVRPGGELQCLYNEELDLSALGPHVDERRASHVEKTNGLSERAYTFLCKQYKDNPPDRMWWADLIPSGGPVLGPFAKRSQALEAEAEWIRENVLKAKR